jgi:hypothetical protein
LYPICYNVFQLNGKNKCFKRYFMLNTKDKKDTTDLNCDRNISPLTSSTRLGLSVFSFALCIQVTKRGITHWLVMRFYGFGLFRLSIQMKR